MGVRAFRVTLAMFGLVVAAVALAGCGGRPDVTGYWEGEVRPEGEPPGEFALDLKGGDDRDIRGTLTLFYEGEDARVPVEGVLDEDGSFRLEPGEGVVIDGKIEGDTMSGNWFGDGLAPPFDAERVSEEEANRRAEEREARYRAAARQEETAEKVEDMNARVAEVIEESPSGTSAGASASASAPVPDSLSSPDVGYSAGDRLEFLEGAGEALMAAVGDPDCEEGTYCDVLRDREARLEEDRPDLEEYAEKERSGEYHLCDQAINVSYWEADATEGAEARHGEVRLMVETVREGLPDRYEEALDLARDAERLAETLPEDERPALSYSVSELEDLRERAAEAAGEPAEEALAWADARKEDYERRIARVTDEALALYEEAGCRE